MHPSFVFVLLAACAPAITAPPPAAPGSRGLRADAHLDAAREHERRAKELARWPDARTGDGGRFDDPSTGLWFRAWDTGLEHERLAATHRGAAAQLQAGYDEACREYTGEVSISPLQRYGLGSSPLPAGVLVFLAPEAGPPERLLTGMRCHRAWMMLADAGMDQCPLDLAGLQLAAHGDATGITVELARSPIPGSSPSSSAGPHAISRSRSGGARSSSDRARVARPPRRPALPARARSVAAHGRPGRLVGRDDLAAQPVPPCARAVGILPTQLADL